MTEPYTPTTEDIRGAYYAWNDGQPDTDVEKPTWSIQEFDRWLIREIEAAEYSGYRRAKDERN